MTLSIVFSRKQLAQFNAELLFMAVFLLILLPIQLASYSYLLRKQTAFMKQQLIEMKAFNAEIHAQIDECMKNPQTCIVQNQNSIDDDDGLKQISQTNWRSKC